MSSEISSSCHSFCDTGHPFIMACYIHTSCRAFGNESVTTSFCDCRSGSQPSACEVNALTDCATAAVQVSMYYNQNNNTYINIHILTPVPESKNKSPVSLFVYKETKGQVLLTRLKNQCHMFQYVWHDEDLPLLKAPIKGLNFQPFTSSYECNTFKQDVIQYITQLVNPLIPLPKKKHENLQHV